MNITQKMVKEILDDLSVCPEKADIKDFLGFMEENMESIIRSQWTAYILSQMGNKDTVMVKTNSMDCQYIQIQESSNGEGYDYTIYNEDGQDLDGGDLETDIPMFDALMQIIDDLDSDDIVITRILSDDEAEEILDKDYGWTFNKNRNNDFIDYDEEEEEWKAAASKCSYYPRVV